MAHIMSIDSGTTSVRALLFDEQGRTLGMCQEEIHQSYPQAGWVEEDPREILEKQISVCRRLLAQCALSAQEVDAIGITNQRETLVAWQRSTGQCVYPAIVWQCRRTEEICDQITKRGLAPWLHEKTGLIPDAYFSATKMQWILQNVEGAREMAASGELLFGTIDTWLMYALTGGKVYATDYTNASRTMLFNLQTLDWDEELLAFFGVTRDNLPQVQESGSFFGETDPALFGAPIPILAVLGDQQSALFGQGCFEKSQAKCTYGTGAFILSNIGEKPLLSKSGLLTTVAWGLQGQTAYALEGSIFMAGAVLQWLRDNLGLIRKAVDSEGLARSVPDTAGVYFVSSFQGLGAPWWENGRRASLYGLTRKTTAAHIVRAALESVAYRVKDVMSAVEREMGVPCMFLRADGGMSANAFLMQFQSDILQIPVCRLKSTEITAQGAAFLAGLTGGIWKSRQEVARLIEEKERLYPAMDPEQANALYQGWLHALQIEKEKSE